MRVRKGRVQTEDVAVGTRAERARGSHRIKTGNDCVVLC